MWSSLGQPVQLGRSRRRPAAPPAAMFTETTRAVWFPTSGWPISSRICAADRRHDHVPDLVLGGQRSRSCAGHDLQVLQPAAQSRSAARSPRRTRPAGAVAMPGSPRLLPVRLLEKPYAFRSARPAASRRRPPPGAATAARWAAGTGVAAAAPARWTGAAGWCGGAGHSRRGSPGADRDRAPGRSNRGAAPTLRPDRSGPRRARPVSRARNVAELGTGQPRRWTRPGRSPGRSGRPVPARRTRSAASLPPPTTARGPRGCRA